MLTLCEVEADLIPVRANGDYFIATSNEAQRAERDAHDGGGSMSMRRAWRILWLAIGLAGVPACGSSDSPTNPDAGARDGAGGSSGNDAAADGASSIGVDARGVLSGSVRMAVPAYFAPGAEWQRLIAAAPTVGLVVINPASGPGSTTDPQYTQVIAQARAAGIIVLGYVSTNYGQRPEADVVADINGYYNLYALSGIYLAEGPMEADCTPLEPQYRRLADAARARDQRAYLAVGTHYCPTYVYFFDLMVEFAMSWSDYQSYAPPTWMPANSPERFCHFISDVPVSDAGPAISRAIANGAGWVFVTEQRVPNPWGQLPSYFDAEVEALRMLAR